MYFWDLSSIKSRIVCQVYNDQWRNQLPQARDIIAVSELCILPSWGIIETLKPVHLRVEILVEDSSEIQAHRPKAMGFLNLLKFTKAKCKFETRMDNFSFNQRHFSSKIKHTTTYLQECYAMALPRASSSTRETHHKPTTRKQWINALVFQKTLLPLLRFEKMPCYRAKKHDGENVEKTHRKPKEQHTLVI